jgi:hypothetical protein
MDQVVAQSLATFARIVSPDRLSIGDVVGPSLDSSVIGPTPLRVVGSDDHTQKANANPQRRKKGLAQPA